VSIVAPRQFKEADFRPKELEVTIMHSTEGIDPLTVLDAIVEQLDGKTWSSDTLDNIAGILRDAGYAVRDEFFAGEPQA
jgi:hypothetical protein